MHKAPPKAPTTVSTPPSAPLPRKPDCNIKSYGATFLWLQRFIFRANCVPLWWVKKDCTSSWECAHVVVCESMLAWVCVWVWDSVCTADCAGFYCSPWWAQRGRLVNVVQCKVKTNKISYLSVVRPQTSIITWVQMGEHRWVLEAVKKGWCMSRRDWPQTNKISARELALLLGNLLQGVAW